jgi:hypothetical protein
MFRLWRDRRGSRQFPFFLEEVTQMELVTASSKNNQIDLRDALDAIGLDPIIRNFENVRATVPPKKDADKIVEARLSMFNSSAMNSVISSAVASMTDETTVEWMSELESNQKDSIVDNDE